MQVLVDTGILLRIFDSSATERPNILFTLRRLWTDNHQLVISSQNVAEFWNVSTRPPSARGGLGLPVTAVEARVKAIERFCTVLPFSTAAYLQWRQLVRDHLITGVSVHDARIAAVMLTNNVQYLLTLNPADFRRYTSITLLPLTNASSGSP